MSYTPSRKEMKTQLLIPFAILDFALSPLVLAQEKAATPAMVNPFQEIPASPSLVQQLEAINEKLDEAFNKHDATAVAEFYTANAILISSLGVASGRPSIEKYVTDLFQRLSPSDRSTKINFVYAFGGDLCALGGWTVTIHGSQAAGGYLINVYTRVGDTWKIRAAVHKYATGP